MRRQRVAMLKQLVQDLGAQREAADVALVEIFELFEAWASREDEAVDELVMFAGEAADVLEEWGRNASRPVDDRVLNLIKRGHELRQRGVSDATPPKGAERGRVGG